MRTIFCTPDVATRKAQLIILNGPWGVGKSTAARLLHARMPGAFHVEVDAIRRGISGYDDNPEESFQFAMRVVRQIIGQCLREGRDVILDKMLRDHQILDEVRAVGAACDAVVHEIILWAEKSTVLARGEQRGYSTGVFSREKAELAWEQMAVLVPERHQATIIRTDALTSDAVVHTLEVTLQQKSP